MAKSKAANSACSRDVVSPREQFRSEAHERIHHVGGVNWPDDFLAAYANDAVDIAAMSKTYRERYEKLSWRGVDAGKADAEVRNAALTVIQCWCEYKREVTASMADFPTGPTGIEIKSGRTEPTEHFCFNASQSDLYEMVRVCCERFKWRLPRLTNSDELRTHQDALNFIMDVDDWIESQRNPTKPNDLEERVASLENAKGVPKEPTKVEKIRKQRNDFSGKLKKKKPTLTWQEIYNAYHGKFPNDKKASPATLRHSFTRNPEK